MNEVLALAQAVKAAHREIERRSNDTMRPLGVTGPQAEAILIIGEREPLALWELGERMIAEAGHPSRLVDRLVDAGHVRRRIPEGNRRRVELTLTPQGRALVPEIIAAQHAAAAAGLSVETRNSIPTSAEILSAATAFGILLALGILAMAVGLLRSETASNMRVLTAAGAGSTARRAISATTAGALSLVGAVVGIVAGYIAAIGFFRASQLDTLSSLSSIPVASLLLILVGMPTAAVLGGWLLGGREPSAIGRRPLG